MENAFEALCELASTEDWCWNLGCTTCGHMHFRYAFAELARGRSPLEPEWNIHREKPIGPEFGELPREYSTDECRVILNLCKDANLDQIACTCAFPAWLGYLGLVLAHMDKAPEEYRNLSLSWSNQLMGMVHQLSGTYKKLADISKGDGLLRWEFLEACEKHVVMVYFNERGLDHELKLLDTHPMTLIDDPGPYWVPMTEARARNKIKESGLPDSATRKLIRPILWCV